MERPASHVSELARWCIRRACDTKSATAVVPTPSLLSGGRLPRISLSTHPVPRFQPSSNDGRGVRRKGVPAQPSSRDTEAIKVGMLAGIWRRTSPGRFRGVSPSVECRDTWSNGPSCRFKSETCRPKHEQLAGRFVFGKHPRKGRQCPHERSCRPIRSMGNGAFRQTTSNKPAAPIPPPAHIDTTT